MSFVCNTTVGWVIICWFEFCSQHQQPKLTLCGHPSRVDKMTTSESWGETGLPHNVPAPYTITHTYSLAV